MVKKVNENFDFQDSKRRKAGVIHMIDLNVLLCKGCSFCIKFCPKGILELGTERSKKGFFYPHLTDSEKCISCGICSVVCPEGAIELSKKEAE